VKITPHMRIHLIAIGGAVMHNLAIALHKKGHQVSGSDDEIFEPARSRLHNYNLLPAHMGWQPASISKSMDAVIIGMHARADNPELLAALQQHLPIFSFPEYIYKESENKKRIAVCGSHGKTTITSMIMHALRFDNRDFDYLVGAQLQGFDTMVQLSDAPVIVLEGDEYFASPLDRRPKFLHYKPQIAVLSGIAWDHYNVFPQWESYLEQFSQLLRAMGTDSTLVYNAEDKNVVELVEQIKPACTLLPYYTSAYLLENEKTRIQYNQNSYTLNVFGKHNMQNMEAAAAVAEMLNIPREKFYKSMETFKGASRRLEVLYDASGRTIFKDFAHSPSKVNATINAVREQYPNRTLIACLELYTYSSLNKDFLPTYKNTMIHADVRIVYFNTHTLELKKLPPILETDIQKFFNDSQLLVFKDSDKLMHALLHYKKENTCILLMSSGNFDNLNFDQLV
ncbi:MAG: UDP-N-acetylmuramate--L-alanine ligase, partial [Chitinophagales bacterium]